MIFWLVRFVVQTLNLFIRVKSWSANGWWEVVEWGLCLLAEQEEGRESWCVFLSVFILIYRWTLQKLLISSNPSMSTVLLSVALYQSCSSCPCLPCIVGCFSGSWQSWNEHLQWLMQCADFRGSCWVTPHAAIPRALFVSWTNTVPSVLSQEQRWQQFKNKCYVWNIQLRHLDSQRTNKVWYFWLLPCPW